MVTDIGLLINKGNKVFVFVPRNPNNIFERDSLRDAKIVYINGLLGAPLKKVRFGNIYCMQDINIIGEPEPLFSGNTIKTLFDLGLISHEYQEENPICFNWLLSELIQIEDEIPDEVFEAVWDNNSSIYEKSINGFLGLTRSVSATKFLIDKGAKICTSPGYGNPIMWHSLRKNRAVERKILKYLMEVSGCNSMDSLMALGERKEEDIV